MGLRIRFTYPQHGTGVREWREIDVHDAQTHPSTGTQLVRGVETRFRSFDFEKMEEIRVVGITPDVKL